MEKSLETGRPAARRSWMQRTSVSTKLTAVTLVFAAIIAASIGVLELSLKISNGVRAYVMGEGLWSRAQKDAAAALDHYGRSRRDDDFQVFQRALGVNFGDRVARTQLELPEPDLALVTRGFQDGGNDLADIPDMIFLFRNFRQVSFLDEAIRTWAAGDAQLDQLVLHAGALRDAVQRGASDPEIDQLLARVASDNQELAVLEKHFSQTLAGGARFVHAALIRGGGALSLLLLGGGVLLARALVAQLRAGVRALQEGTARVAAGDLRGAIEVSSGDELGDLAQAFNSMIEQRRLAGAALDQRLQFETLLARLSSGITALTAAQMDEGINRALADLGRFAQVDRSYVFLFDETHTRVTCSHEWCAPGIEPQIAGLQNLRVADFPWVQARLLRGEVVHVPRVADLPPEAIAERNEWQAESIRSLLLIPMRSGDTLSGFVGFDSVRSETAWPQEATDLLKIFGEIVANMMARVKAEQALQQRNQSLAASIRELERSNDELEQFAYVASHDLKTPLRGINGFVHLLRRKLGDKLDAQSNEYIDLTLRSVEQLQSLISGLLELSRVGKGESVAPVDSEQVLAGVEAQFAPLITERGAIVTHDPLPTLPAAPLELHQLLQNLVGNAIKFQPGATPRVELSAVREGTFWKFSVRDHGIGIRPEHQDKIFQLFQRLNPVDSYEGSGIGLAICRKIVLAHGGRLWVESEPGKGTTFYFTLPA